jgi:predicted transcriptional regulator
MSSHNPSPDDQCDQDDNGTDARTTCLADVKEEAINWLWYGRLAFGKITIVDADPDVGKSLVFCAEIPARITTGRPLPEDTLQPSKKGCLIVSTEDGIADTILPRIRRAGGDPGNVFVWDQLSLPSEILSLEQAIQEHNISYLVIDPIMGCLDPGVKTGDDASVRQALQPLRRMVARTGVACVLIRHFKKSSETKAIYQGGGSIAFSGIARIGLVIARAPENEQNRVIATSKANLIADDEKQSILYIITSDGKGKPPYIRWLGVSQHRANDVIQQSVSQERRDILEVLEQAAGPMSPKEVASATGEPVPNVSKLLAKMASQGEIVKAARGRYSVKDYLDRQEARGDPNLDRHRPDPNDPNALLEPSSSTTTSIQYNKSDPNAWVNLDRLDRLDREEEKSSSFLLEEKGKGAAPVQVARDHRTYRQRVEAYQSDGLGYLEACHRVIEENRLAALKEEVFPVGASTRSLASQRRIVT